MPAALTDRSARRANTATVPATATMTPLHNARAAFAASRTPQQCHWERMLRGWENDTKVTSAQRRWARKMRGVCSSCGLSSHLLAACNKTPDSDDDQDQRAPTPPLG
jgi:hypothetical protein